MTLTGVESMRYAQAVFWILLSSPLAAEGQVPHGQDRPPNQPLSPGEAIKRMKVPKGFVVELVASEPDLVNPTAMTIDEKGRFWIAESLEYPRKSAGPGRDRIKVLEDTDGDGKVDKFTVFADGLNIPSGVAVGFGGVWVANSPDILFMKDTDGDGKADVREVVVTGFGRDDTHELPNSLTWSPDGKLLGWNGVFNGSRVRQGNKRFDFTCAIFRIDPRSRRFDLFCEGTSNPWGISFDSEGSAFASACVIDHLWHLTETGYYRRQGGPYPPFTWIIESIVDHRHQKAAYCGILCLDSPTFPKRYRGQVFMGNIHGNCINVDSLERRGSSYFAKPEEDFLTANDAWFMPVSLKIGPDGSLYVLDWYDRYHCYQDANRDPEGIDRLKGRLYRVRPISKAERPRPRDLSKLDDEELSQSLGSRNVYERETARRLLQERKSSKSTDRLMKLVENEKTDRTRRLNALWTLIGSGPLDARFHLRTLHDADPTVRAWAVRAAGNMGQVEGSIRSTVAKLAADPSADVRLQVAVAARKIDGLDPIATLIETQEQSKDDSVIPAVVWRNLEPLLIDRLDLVVSLVEKAADEKLRALAQLLPKILERVCGEKKIDTAASTAIIRKLMESQDETNIREGLTLLSRKLRSSPRDSTFRKDIHERLRTLISRAAIDHPDGPLAVDYLLTLASCGDFQGIAAARATFGRVEAGSARRAQALEVLIWADRPEEVLKLVSPILIDRDGKRGETVAFRADVLSALGGLDDPKVASILLDALPKLAPELRPLAIELLTQRPIWSVPLLKAIESGKVSADALNVNQIRKLFGGNDAEVKRLAKSIWATVREGRSPDRERVVAQMRERLKTTPGDPAAGVAVFRKLCAQCHKIHGEGNEVGPDLTGNGRASFDQLLSNVFDPNLVIGSAYQGTTVATKDGRFLVGLLVEDNDARIVLRLQGGKLETIPKSNVEESKTGGLSLMPEQIETQLTLREWADLFAFLALDKPFGDPAAKPIPGAEEILPGLRKTRK